MASRVTCARDDDDGDDDVHFILDQHVEFVVDSANSQKQHVGRQVVPLWKGILIPSQLVFVLTH
jgi:hypothetical protein